MEPSWCFFDNGVEYLFANKEQYGFMFLQNIKPSLLKDVNILLENEYDALEWNDFEDSDLETTEHLKEFITWYNQKASPKCILEDFEPIPEEFLEHFQTFSKKSCRFVFSFKLNTPNVLTFLQSRWTGVYPFPNFEIMHFDADLQQEFLDDRFESSQDCPMSGAGAGEGNPDDSSEDEKTFRLMCVLIAMGYTGETISGTFDI
jgi:hypothetical protein